MMQLLGDIAVASLVMLVVTLVAYWRAERRRTR